MAAAHLAQRIENLLAFEVEMIGKRQQQMLGGEVLVAQIVARLVGSLDGRGEFATYPSLGTVGRGEGGDLAVDAVSNRQQRLAEVVEDG